MLFQNSKIIRQALFLIPTIIVVTLIACSGDSTAKEKPKFIFKEGQGPAGAVASVDGQMISEDELMGSERLEFADVLKKLYDLRMERLGQIVLEKKYAPEAKKAGVSLEEYVSTKVLKGDVKIPDAEYNKFVAEKKIPKEQLNDQLKDRILNYMKSQKKQEQLQDLITKLTKEHKIEVYFQKPNLRVNVEVGDAASFGPKDSKVNIIEFSDFECPFCSRVLPTITELKKKYGNKVRFAFKQFPLPMHPKAKPAAEASLCVNEQSSDKFWKFHDKLFLNQDKIDLEDMKKYVKEIGADEKKFLTCFESHKFAKKVQEDLDYGSRVGVRSTPTFFINGRLVSGAQPFENFKEIIEEELAGKM